MTRPARPSAGELRQGEAAAWGSRAIDRPRLRLVAYRRCVWGALRGFAVVELAIGLRLHDVAIFTGPNGPWAALPTKAQLDRERRQKLGADGKPAFAPVAEWRTRELADRFSAAVLQLVRQAYPDELDEAGA
jgi:hypothetical protein